jgi:hypothetical protein
MKLLEFHQLSQARALFLLWLLKLIPGELVKEEHPLINRVIAKKPTASCQNLQFLPAVLSDDSLSAKEDPLRKPVNRVSAK